jgi:hypothetical protein
MFVARRSCGSTKFDEQIRPINPLGKRESFAPAQPYQWHSIRQPEICRRDYMAEFLISKRFHHHMHIAQGDISNPISAGNPLLEEPYDLSNLQSVHAAIQNIKTLQARRSEIIDDLGNTAI